MCDLKKKSKKTKTQTCKTCDRDYYVKPRDKKKFTGCPYCEPRKEYKRCLRCDQWFFSKVNYVCVDCKSSKEWQDASKETIYSDLSFSWGLSASQNNFSSFDEVEHD